MSLWRPPPAIQPKVIGLLIRERHLFAYEVPNAAGQLDGVRPLGGTIHFGETREAALHREFSEELGARIEILGGWSAFENIFVFEGQPGHEYLFAAPIRLLDRELPLNEAVTFTESNGERCLARWFPLDRLIAGEPALYPNGLRDALLASDLLDEA